MNPELTYTVSKYQTAAGGTDIFAHTYMRFFNLDASYLGDEFCISVLRTVSKYTPVAVESPTDYEARAELMIAAAFSHNDLTSIGKNLGHSSGEHWLEHQLSGYFDTAHGAGLAVIMPAYLRYILDHGSEEQIRRVAYFAVRVFDSEPDDENPRKVAEDGTGRFTSWLKSIGMPVTLTELGLSGNDIQTAVERCLKSLGGKVGGFIDIDSDGIAELYESAV